MFRADLHLHSIFSDGSLAPKELVSRVQESGLLGFCITDHDAIAAYPEVISLAEEAGLHTGTGVEFSAFFEGISVHLLGYGFSLTGQAVLALSLRHQKRRKERNCAIIEKLKEKKIFLREEDLVGTVVGRPHLAEQMVKKGYVSSCQEAFRNYLAEGKCCYFRGEMIAAEETIEAIHRDGGKAVLAHPHLLPQRKKWLERLLQLPFDGLECYYGRFSRNEAEKWLQRARQKGLLITGGSDFHGERKPYAMIGSSWIDRESFDKIFL
ncbi:MAG: hypothetical protein A2Y28_00995 [Chlamydiae bacterium GWC2_50_10]|nr:MAG: hypothetical protein A2Y28_00995 [Chlamydiae bacterium GWC2_50_10]